MGPTSTSSRTCTERSPRSRRRILLVALLLAFLCAGASHAIEPSVKVWVKGGAHVPADGRLRDLYHWIPEAGLGIRVGELSWSRMEAEASIRWASGRPSAAPFVEEADSRWLAVPVSLSLHRSFGGGLVAPFARLGILGQWSRESFETRVGGEVIERDASQLRPGLLLEGGLQSGGDGLQWRAEGSWQWVPGDHLAVNDSRSRETESMNLGGFSLSFGIFFP